MAFEISRAYIDRRCKAGIMYVSVHEHLSSMKHIYFVLLAISTSDNELLSLAESAFCEKETDSLA